MRICKTEEIKDKAILAKDILTNDYQILLAKGTVLKTEYIKKLQDLGISEVYIKEESVVIEEIKIVLLKKDVEETFKENVRSIMEKHIYQNNEELSELNSMADRIITNILQEEEVIEKVYDIKERSADIYEHCISLCALTTLVSLKMNLSDEMIHDMAVACLLHDLGLRYLTVNYENQNLEELSDIDYAEYKKHPIYAYTSLKEEPWISEISKNIILMHHEHIDGSGYPLKINDLPLEVRIVSICDVFDEMICGIGCERIKVHEAVEYLKICKGVFYDEDVINTFLKFTAVYPVGTRVTISDGSKGIVVSQNRDYPERPNIRLTVDKEGNLVTDIIIVSLVIDKELFVESVIS